MKEQIIKGGETKEKRQEAEAVAFQALQGKKAADEALAKEKKEQEGREEDIRKVFQTKINKAKIESEVQIQKAVEKAEAIE